MTDRLLCSGLRCRTLSAGRDGRYAGFYPSEQRSGGRAFGESCDLQGAEFFVFPATATWWLEYYAELARYLLTTARAIAHDQYCLVFDLGRRRTEGYSEL